MQTATRTDAPDVRWSRELGAWLVAGHDAVEQVLRSTDYASASPGARNLQAVEGPEHARGRALIARSFAAGAVAALRPAAEALVDEALDRRAGGGSFDLMPDVAWPVAMGIMCLVLGIPASTSRQAADWTRRVAAAMGQSEESPARREAAVAVGEVDELLSVLIARPRAGLIGALARSGELGVAELLAMGRLVLFAGSHPTALAIGNACASLIQHPDQLRRLRRDRRLLAPAVEETLRFETVIQIGTPRRAARTTSLRGHEIREGEHVLPHYGHANRDASRFPHPDQLDITRRPCPHLAFGRGRHACPAPALARLLLALVIARLMDRFPRLELAARPVVIESPVMRGPHSLPLGS